MIPFVEKIRSFFHGPGWQELVTIALILSIVFWLCCLLGIVYFYIKGYRYKKNYNKIYPTIRDFLFEYIFDERYVHNLPIEKLNLPMNNKLVRSITRQVIHEYISSIGGDVNKNIRNFFIELGFEKEAKQELEYSRFNKDIVIRSLQDLSVLKVNIKESLKSKLLENNDKDIRVATAKYLIQVDGEKSFDQIFSSLHNISSLNALELYQTIILEGFFEHYIFSKWIHPSKSYPVNALFMDLMVHYQQNDEQALWNLIYVGEAENLKIGIKAINTLGKIIAVGSERALMDLYLENNNSEYKKEILKALGRLGQGECTSFLLSIFDNENSSIELKKHAYKSLLNQAPFSDKTLHDLHNRVSELQNIKIMNYVDSPMVHYI